MSPLEIRPFGAVPDRIADSAPRSYASESPLLPKHIHSEQQSNESWPVLRTSVSRIKNRYRALPALARGVLLLVALGCIYVVRFTWTDGVFALPFPSISSSSPSTNISLNDPAPLVDRPLLEQLSSLIIDQISATWLDDEMRALPEEFRRLAGAYPNPLFPLARLSEPQERRYAHLRYHSDLQRSKFAKVGDIAKKGGEGKFLLVASLKDVDHILYDLMNTILVLTSFLGAHQISLSIIEGPSKDKSASILEEILKPALLRIGVKASDINLRVNAEKVEWKMRNRIELLAELRNQALGPVWLDNDLDSQGSTLVGPDKAVTHGRTAGKDVRAIVFFNDVFVSAAHILELLHQHAKIGLARGASPSMTTAMDYRIGNDGDETFFYDVWVSRLVENGDMFRDFPHEGEGHHLFRGFDELKQRYKTLQPFQAYCAWNGVAVIDPKVFLPPYNIRFRRSDKEAGECAASECSLFCNDLWRMGLGRIQVVPSVRVAYDLKIATRTLTETEDAKAENGWYDGVPPDEDVDRSFRWVEEPPRLIRCFPWPERLGPLQWPWDDFKWVDPWLGYSHK